MLLILARLIRVVLILLLARLIFRAVAGFVRGLQEGLKSPEVGPPAVPASELVRDRICNTFLPRDRALMAMVSGHPEHFCSADCRDRALASASGLR